ncbi:MAG: sugar porter family MFS transporter [bacterium]
MTGHLFKIISITSIAALAGLLFGYDTGVIGGSQLYFTEYFNFTATQQGWAVSSALYGCLIGAVLAGFMTKFLGRKISLIIAAILFVISAWGSGVADSLSSLVFFRLIGGIGVGLASMSAPMYIAEISPPASRGRMVSLYQLAIVIGFFVVFLATYFIGGGDASTHTPEELQHIHDYNLQHGWRVMFWSELLPAGLFLVLLLFVPRSPRWLVMRGREAQALAVLKTITENDAAATQELNVIKRSLNEAPHTALSDIFKKGLGVALFVGVMLSVFQQITGINAILYYGAEIFANALGYGPEDALKQQLWLGAVNLIFTFVAIFTVDSLGRKPLLIIGNIGMFLGLSVLGYTIYSQQLGIISLIAVLTFIASFALSMGPIVWVMLSEIFPNHVRSAAMSIAVGAQWLFNAIVANTFPIVNNSTVNAQSFNGALPYFIFAAFCIVTIVFVWRMVPETKGKSLEEMEAFWHKG